MKKKVRIIKRNGVDGRVQYIIQQKGIFPLWGWNDAWLYSSCGAYCQDYFDTYKEAVNNLCYFDNSKCTEEVMSPF